MKYWRFVLINNAAIFAKQQKSSVKDIVFNVVLNTISAIVWIYTISSIAFRYRLPLRIKYLAHLSQRLHLHPRLSFKVKELVTIIFVLLAALGDLCFQVGDRSGERIENAHYPLLFGKGGDWNHNITHIGLINLRRRTSYDIGNINTLKCVIKEP